MKRMNFPGRKMRRKIDAEKRQSGESGRVYTPEEMARLDAAQRVKTKGGGRGRS